MSELLDLPLMHVVDLPLIHVVLVADDIAFQKAFRAAISLAPDMKLMTVASNRAQALQVIEGAPADILVVDLGLPDGSGIDVIRAAQLAWPSCAIMVSTTFGDEMHVIGSIEAGASGYLLKDSSPKALTDEIRCLHGGGSPISPLIARHILMRFRPDNSAAAPANQPIQSQVQIDLAAEQATTASLSVRERQVLDLITKGFTYEEIANLMAISRNTVMTFVRRIYSKLEVKSKAEAIYEARLQGLLGH